MSRSIARNVCVVKYSNWDICIADGSKWYIFSIQLVSQGLPTTL